jgi:type I restriction enzyme R subunit
MSKLLHDLIQQSRTDAAAYEAFLKQAEELARKLVKKAGGDYPSKLHGHAEAIVLFRNLPQITGAHFQCPESEDERADLALKLDQAMREKAPSGWRGDEIRERQVLDALFAIMNKDRDATRAIFDLIKNQPGYP